MPPMAKAKSSTAPPQQRAREALAWLERRGTKRNRDGMARYAITAPKVFGVSVGMIRAARWVGKDALRELTSAAVRRRLARR